MQSKKVIWKSMKQMEKCYNFITFNLGTNFTNLIVIVP